MKPRGKYEHSHFTAEKTDSQQGQDLALAHTASKCRSRNDVQVFQTPQCMLIVIPQLLLLPLDHKAHPRGDCRRSATSSSYQTSDDGARTLGSVPPLGTNPFSSEGQRLWEEGQGRRCEPRPAVCVWIPINSQEVKFPCQGDWKEGRDGTLCSCRWAPGNGLPHGRPQTRFYMLRKPYCHETDRMTWPYFRKFEDRHAHDASKNPSSPRSAARAQKQLMKAIGSCRHTCAHTSHTIICLP